jgi:hypothetical protein
MSCFTIPKWRYITLTEEQRKELKKVDVQKLVQVWEENASPAADRVWDLTQAIKVSTFIEQKEDLQRTVPDTEIPLGLVCMRTPPEAANLLPETNIALASLFEHLKLPKSPPTMLYIFNKLPGHSHVSLSKNIHNFLRSKSEFEVIDRFWSIYMKKLAEYFCHSVDVTSDHIARNEQLMINNSDFIILKYDNLAGLFMHMDGLRGADSTVFAVGVGREVVYDMTRALGRNARHEVSIIRSSNPEGTMMVLDGEARYKWAHGVPGSHTNNGVKYSIIMRIYHKAGLVRPIGKCIELNTEMYSIASSTKPEHEKTESNPHMGAQDDSFLDDSLLGLLMQLEHTCIDTHIPDRIKRPGLPRLHPRPGWL